MRQTSPTDTTPRQPAGTKLPDAAQLAAAALDDLLVSGGDPRIALDAAGLNSYGCSPVPLAGVISFASSTASSISARAYAQVEKARQDLLAAARNDGLEKAFDDRLARMRVELMQYLGLDETGAEVVFSPSGTDAQLLALFVAQAFRGQRMTSIVVAANETGSGTAFTAQGRHFNNLTAQGIAVGKDDVLKGMGEAARCMNIPVRDAAGQAIDPQTVEAQVLTAIENAIAEGNKVLLQAMDSSKLGCRNPGHACLRQIAQRWPDDVVIVIDACQMRLGRARLRRYLDDGFLVLLTGSKFFTGPPFSGGLLVPQHSVSALEALTDVAPGLADYTNRSDWPRIFPVLRGKLPARLNIGQWLRWEAALAEMRDYFAVSADKRRAVLEDFASHVTQALDAAPSLTLLPRPVAGHDVLDDGEMAVRSIFAFTLQRNGAALGADDCRKIYQALTRDVTALLPVEATAREKQVAAQSCHIGQPVALGTAPAVLRINAGARMVAEGVSKDDIQTVVDKIELLLRYLDKIG